MPKKRTLESVQKLLRHHVAAKQCWSITTLKIIFIKLNGTANFRHSYRLWKKSLLLLSYRNPTESNGPLWNTSQYLYCKSKICKMIRSVRMYVLFRKCCGHMKTFNYGLFHRPEKITKNIDLSDMKTWQTSTSDMMTWYYRLKYT